MDPADLHSSEMSYVETSIRPALVYYARSIAEVHVESWKTTYTGIFPDALLKSLSIDNRESSWKEALAQPDLVTLVGCDAGDKVLGFICGGDEKTRQLKCDGELHAIYILQVAQRQGLGTLLVSRFVRELRTQGFTSMAVWVLALNPFRKFYEALGGQIIAEQQIERGGKAFTEVAYGWSDLSRFEP